MAKRRAGWERKLYRGTAGSTATDQVTPNVQDVGVSGGTTLSSTTARGDGSAIPKESQQVVSLNASLTFSMIYDDGDADFAAIIAAAVAGTALAFKTERVVSGSYTSEFDGDCTLSYDAPGGLSDGMVVTFTGTPTREAGRDYTLA